MEDWVAVGFQAVPRLGPSHTPCPRPLLREGSCVRALHLPTLAPRDRCQNPSPRPAARGGTSPRRPCQAGWGGLGPGLPPPQHSFARGSSSVFRVSYGASFAAMTESPARAGEDCGDRLWSRGDLGPILIPPLSLSSLSYKMGR